MEDWVLRMPWKGAKAELHDALLDREWIVTNGLGGYASGTIAGAVSRRFHGLLVAALPAPMGRRMMFNHLSELVRLADGSTFFLGGGDERAGGVLELPGAAHLTEFRLELGLPIWRYEFGGVAVEKRIMLVHGQNTVHIAYDLVKGNEPVRLKLLPSVHFRPHEAAVQRASDDVYSMTAHGGHYEVAAKGEGPPLRLMIYGERSAFTFETSSRADVLYRVEARRGYDHQGSLWSPGYFRVDLRRDKPATLIASTEPWSIITALTPEQAMAAEGDRHQRLLAAAHPAVRRGPARELVLAADQFLIAPTGRQQDAAWAKAAGDEIRTVIAGYHWFTDWGRDTMISLEGLTLTTGRYAEAGYILRTFAHYFRDGLIPNMFPEGEHLGLYHTADATLWYFQALERYVQTTDDRATLRLVLPTLRGAIEHHVRGTHFGIGVDPEDGLLRQGQEGYQLTWMDAKVGDWVVTPRRGKAVEINALWYNALCLMQQWHDEEKDSATSQDMAARAEKVRDAFNRRFWCDSEQYLYDVIDGPDGNDLACRPNQLLAISLTYPVLDEAHWPAVLKVATERLLTPVGLRSLAPGHPLYKPKYYGDLRSRDAAYHQGTAWGWLIGPYIDAFLKVHPQNAPEARQVLQGFVAHLGEAGIGSISEIFDAESPFTPRGCIAQAWSVAEVLRCWAKTAS